jgi:hypothetical protein
MRYFLRHLHVLECQVEELWTCIAKKDARLTPWETLAAIAGDAWVRKQWKPVTPAMAAGLTAHVWTIDALLNLRVAPNHL